MKVKITEELFRTAPRKFQPYLTKQEEDSFRWEKFVAVDLKTLSLKRIEQLKQLAQPHAKTIRGTGVLVADLDRWLKALGGDAKVVKGRSVEQFTSLLTEFLRAVPGHRIYKRDKYVDDVWHPYYVEEVVYHPPVRHQYSESPAYCALDTVYIEYGRAKAQSWHFGHEAVRGKTPEEAMAEVGGLFIETFELRADYKSDLARYEQLGSQIGKQLLARGTARDDLDKIERYWWWDMVHDVRLDVDGEPARVVVDVLKESDEEGRASDNKDASWNPHFWNRKGYAVSDDDGETEDDEDDEPEEGENRDTRKNLPLEDTEEGEAGLGIIEIPIHARLPCFDMKRHRRVSIHVRQLDEYVYNPDMGKQLVLPDDVNELVTMLLSHRAGFVDIVKGKGGGVIVLCAGPAGTGKCLGRGTPVLMYDGRIEPVEKVLQGDSLMGPDSIPRRVLSTTTGAGPLYRIVPNKGEPWVCNDAHILTLVHSLSGEVMDVALTDYLRMPASTKHNLKLFQPTRIDFTCPTADGPDRQDPTPYFMGVWLGDGTKNMRGVSVSKPDAEIEQACRDEAGRYGLKVRVQIHTRTGCPTYHLHRENHSNERNPLLDRLRALMAETGIRVPRAYRTGNFDVRANVLAGLLDTDGHATCGGYEIVQRDEQVADDIAFLARSLGLRVTRRLKYVAGGTYHRLSISGDCTILPLRIPRKKAQPRKQKKDARRTGFRVEAIGDGEFFGFTLDGDGRFLLGDFTVTHNTLTAEVYSEVMGRPLYTVQASQLGTDEEKLEQELLKVFARAQRWNAIALIDEADVYVRSRGDDLTQNAIVGVFLRVLEYYRGVLFMTTNRADLVDDAISSRCVARINYAVPPADQQRRLWEILSDVMGVQLHHKTIDEAVAAYPRLSGRDIKNLLKLSKLVSDAKGGAKVTFRTLEFAKKFKPTDEQDKRPAATPRPSGGTTR